MIREFSNTRIVFSVAKTVTDLMSLSFNSSKFSVPFQVPKLFLICNSSKPVNLTGGNNLLLSECDWPMFSFVTALNK